MRFFLAGAAQKARTFIIQVNRPALGGTMRESSNNRFYPVDIRMSTRFLAAAALSATSPAAFPYLEWKTTRKEKPPSRWAKPASGGDGDTGYCYLTISPPICLALHK
jgi:hypothetical protein